jgi:hypothetical protein
MVKLTAAFGKAWDIRTRLIDDDVRFCHGNAPTASSRHASDQD